MRVVLTADKKLKQVRVYDPKNNSWILEFRGGLTAQEKAAVQLGAQPRIFVSSEKRLKEVVEPKHSPVVRKKMEKLEAAEK